MSAGVVVEYRCARNTSRCAQLFVIISHSHKHGMALITADNMYTDGCNGEGDILLNILNTTFSKE